MFRQTRRLVLVSRRNVNNAREVKNVAPYNNQQHTKLYSSDTSFNYSQTIYLNAVNETIETIAHQIEDMVDEGAFDESLGENTEVEVTNSDGVLNISIGKSNTFIISRQTPSRQLWLSSPISGPWHYNFDAVKRDWLCTKGETNFYDRLDTEFTKAFGVQFSVKRLQ